MRRTVENWLVTTKKNLFFYKDGFYQIPYLGNSPEMLVEGFKGMPFIKNYPKQNCYTTNNPFFSGDGHYQKLEEGLWIMMTNIKVEKDINFRVEYKEKQPKNYDFLTLHISKTPDKLSKTDVKQDSLHKSWALFKAGSEASNYHFKGQESILLTFFLSEEWKQKNIVENKDFAGSFLETFFQSTSDFLFLPNFLENKKDSYQGIIDCLLNKDEYGVKNVLSLKIKTLEIISSFVEKINNRKKEIINISKSDTAKLLKAECFLMEKLYDGFPSITAVSKKIGMSETKLKMEFKRLYDKTLFQYFQHYQMKKAAELLNTNQYSVKEIAFTFGYSNPSKFSATFKKVIGHLPSEILN